MSQNNASAKRTYIFEQAPISQAVFTLAVPTVITQLINIIYNFADTWYVGRTQNAAMVAALSVCMPIYVIMAAIANLFGIGGSSVISRMLGQHDTKRAGKTFAFCFWFGLLAACLYGIVMLVFRRPLAYLIGGDDNSFPYINEYIFWTMIVGVIPSVGNVLCGHLVRSIGASREAGFGMSLGGLLNIVLDPLFMFVLLPEGQEVKGAAIATLISNTCSFLYFLLYLYRNRDNPVFQLSPRKITFQDHIPQDVLSIGLAAALQTTLAMVSNMFANALVKPYGTEAVSGMGVAKKINTLAFNTTMGLTQGVLPLLGYSIGSKNHKRFTQTVRFTGICALIFDMACLVLFYIFAEPLVRFFIDEEQTVAYGSQFLRIIAFAAPLAALCYLFNTVFQAAGRKGQSFLLSTFRKGLCDIPLMFLFRALFGVTGVTLATPVTEVISTTIAVILYLQFRKKYLNE